ncbi:PREDICTED: uncharacterized protein LOC105110760 isoform X3 [Populus euphratica]|uniref:holo-[acyl-carrier-protein] synthase n=1 Tax=Populus euphratica TaxID=75702 RepID=A0AAJ6T4V7_POPEU|nr:PREDICTED: uncharacterized protein LOC105110760 isoform X3 [Populus euphratica]
MFSFMQKMLRFQRSFSVSPCPTLPLQLPSPMETHLWFVVPDEFKSVSLLNQYMELLSPCEKENVLSMRGEQLQKSALLARTLVRTTIARYQINNRVVDPRSLKFKRNVHGKPEVSFHLLIQKEWESDGGQCPSPLHFNISHTSSLIACGVTLNSSIGIDIEEKQRKIKNNILSFARRYFSLHEVEHLSAISDSEVQRQEFVKLWTLKASEVVVESSDHHERFTNNWQFGLFELASSHYAAVCMEKDKTRDAGVSGPMRLTVRKTIPFVEDECISGTDAVVPLAGLIEQF